MKYLIRIFTINSEEDDEVLLQETELDYLPYVPRISENILIEGVNYKVIGIVSSFEDYFSEEKEMWIEMMVEPLPIRLDWWE